MVSGHQYKQWLMKKNKGSDLSIEKKSHPSKSERLDFLLRRVKAAGCVKRSNSSKHSTQAEVNPKEKKHESETVQDTDKSVLEKEYDLFDLQKEMKHESETVHNTDKSVLEKEYEPFDLQKEKEHESKTIHDTDKSLLEKEYELFDAHVAKSSKPNFVEYWVPVGLSEMQTELYCGTLLSNADLLCSYSKHGSMELLNDIFVSILISTKKCCDHPYLVDGSLSTSLMQDIPKPELLNAEIRLSNKLLLFHKVLREIRKRGLRVLILYQSFGGSGSFSVGDILEEIIDQEFGTDVSVRLGGSGRISASQKRAALNTFNDKNNERLVCLMETRSCVPSIKLTSMDVVIFFNSDWNPMNDLKALQRLDLDSQSKHVKVFRLYTSNTLEEKTLILSKQGMALEGYISDIKQSICHQLLTWGASYLFSKLDEFHDGNSSVPEHMPSVSVVNSVEDVFAELSNLLPDNEKSSVCEIKKSLIEEVKNVDGVYSSNISLLGEVEKNRLVDSKMLKEPRVFWRKILKGRNPTWKYFASQPRRLKKSVPQACDLPEPASRKRRKVARSTLFQFPSNIRRKIRSKLRKRDTGRKLSGSVLFSQRSHPVISNVQRDWLPSSRTTQNDHSHGTHPPEVHQPNVHLISRNLEPPELSHISLKPVCRALMIELEGLQKQKSELLKMHEEKKLQTMKECKKEIDQIRKKYDMLLQNAESIFLEEKKVIDAKHSKVLINKTLAEAVVHKYSEEDSTLSEVTSKCSSEEMHNLFLRWSGSNTVLAPNQVAGIQPGCSIPKGPTHESHPGSLASRSNQYIPKFQPVRQPAPHFWHTRSPQPVTAPKLSPPGAGFFPPVFSRSSLAGLPL